MTRKIVTYRDRIRDYRGEYEISDRTIVVLWNGKQETGLIEEMDDTAECAARRILGDLVDRENKAAR